MPPRPLSLLIAAAVALVLPATALAKPGGASPNSPAKPGMVPSHKQKLTAPRCGLHEETDPVRVLRDQDRHDTKIEAKYALGAIGETITLTATLQLMDGETVAFKPVEFTVDSQVIGTAKTNSKGEAQLAYKVPNKFGPKTWVARYAGNSKCKGATDSSSVGTVRAPTEITYSPYQGYANIGVNKTIHCGLKRTTDGAVISGREIEVFVGGAQVAKVVTSAGGSFSFDYTPTSGANKPLEFKVQFLGDVLYNPKVSTLSVPLYPPRRTVYIRGASVSGVYGQTVSAPTLVTFDMPVTGPKFGGAPVRVWYTLGNNDTVHLGKATTNNLGVGAISFKITQKPGVYNLNAFADVQRELYDINHDGWWPVKLTVLKSPVVLSAIGPTSVAIGSKVSYAVKAVRTTDKEGIKGLSVCFGYECVKTDSAGRATLTFTVPSDGGTGPRTLTIVSRDDDYHLAGIKHVAVEAKPSVN
ncbi:MAG: Ig-like domain repeat protein [Myxococcales bacterium]|nr:Ig-like domain repeat protein [Myxococcales bacterium]